jgi:hypothetical protein
MGQDCARTIPANLLDLKDFHPVPAVEVDRLHGSLGNNPAAISKVDKIKSNRILLLIDVSASQERDFAFLQSQLDLLLEKTPPGSPIAYGFFNDRTFGLSGFSTDPREILGASGSLRNMKPKSHTAIFDAVHEGLTLFQTPLPGDSILVLSDGGENHSKVTQESLAKELGARGVRFFAILQTHGDPIAPEDVEGPQALNNLARQTGGAAYTFPTSEVTWSDKTSRMKMVDAVRTFWLEGVGSGYLLTMAVPTDPKKNGRLKIWFDKGPDARLKNVTVLYPRYLAPCEATSAAVQ